MEGRLFSEIVIHNLTMALVPGNPTPDIILTNITEIPAYKIGYTRLKCNGIKMIRVFYPCPFCVQPYIPLQVIHYAILPC